MPDFKQEVKNLQKKKQAVMNTAYNGQKKGSPKTALTQGKKAQTKAAKTDDALREKYVKILEHDFTGQNWIIKNKERRANINKNYRIVTGATDDLSHAEAASRRNAVEARRRLSLSASSLLADHITSRDQRKEQWAGRDKAALAKELISVQPEEFSFDSDEDFLASFGKKMILLDDAASLLKEVSDGSVPKGYDAKELSEKLMLLGEIRTAYENRIKIITSPYYLSVREEDLTDSTKKHLELISKGKVKADDSLKNYAEAVIGWETLKTRLFSKNKIKENNMEENKAEENEAEIPLPDYHVRVADMNAVIADSEQQEGLNCYGCSGSLAFNLFLKNTGEYTDQKKTDQKQIRAYVPKNMKTFEELKDVFEKEMGFDLSDPQQQQDAKKLYDDYTAATMRFCGKRKVAEGNIYEIADFFMERSEDVALHKMIFHMPGKEGKIANHNQVPYASAAEKTDADKLYRRMKVTLLNKVKDVLESGNVVSLLMMNTKRHYITIVGIEGQEFIYADSLYGKEERRKPIEELFDRTAMGDTAEITWFSKVDSPEKLKADYPDAGLEYDPENGFTAKTRNATDHLYMGHRKGISVSREAMQNVSESVYLPTNKKAWKDEPAEVYEKDEEEPASKKKEADKQIKTTFPDQNEEEIKEKKEEKPKVEKKAKKSKKIQAPSSAEKGSEVTSPVKQSEQSDADRVRQTQQTYIMNAILNKSVRTGFNMKEAAGRYDKKLYDLDSTEQDIKDAGEILSALEKGTLKVEDRELALAKLTAVNGRNLSHILLNDQKFGGDSNEMQKVKTSIEQLETVLTKQGKKQLTQKDIDYIAYLYRRAMDSCRNYCDTKDPSKKTGIRRWTLVRAALTRLTREAELIEIGSMALKDGDRKEMEITSGVDLLSFGGLSDYTARLRRRNPLKELRSRQEDLDVQKAEYDELQQRKEKEYKETYGFLASVRIAFDSDLKDAKASLDEKEKELSQLNESYKNAQDKHEQELLNAEENLKALPKDIRRIAEMFRLGQAPTALIKNPKKCSSADKALMTESLRAMRALIILSSVSPNASTVNLYGKFVRFVSDAYGNLTMQTGGISVPLSSRGDEIAAVISRDVIENRELYGNNAVRDVISSQKTGLPEMTRGELLRAREYCAGVLHGETGIALNLLNNVSLADLKRYALLAMKENVNKTKFKQEFKKFVDTQNETHREQNINSVLNLELMSTGVELADGVKLFAEEQENSGWSKEEEMVRDLASDLLFSKDTWIADSKVKSPGERIRDVLLEHSAALALIISDQFRDREENPDGIIESMLDKLPLFALGSGDAGKLKEKVKKALNDLRSFIEEEADDALADMKIGDAGKGLAEWRLKNRYWVEDLLQKKLKDLDKEQMKKLADVDKDLDEAVKNAMNDVQDAFDECVDDIFMSEEDKQQEKEEQIKPQIKKEAQKKKGQNTAADAIAAKKAAEKEAKKKRMDAIRQRMENRINDRRRLEEEIARDKAAIEAKRAELPEKEAGLKKASVEKQEEYVRLNNEQKELFDELADVDEETRNALREYDIKARQADEHNMDIGMRPLPPQQNPKHIELVKKIEEYDARLTELQNATEAIENERSALDNPIKEMEKAVADKEKALKEFPKRSSQELENILDDTAKGRKGQGLFMKNVFKTYFRSMPVMDQRSMIAGAIKNSKPVLSENKNHKIDLSSDEGMELASAMLGGMFKGAGPLFQKMLQGIPLSGNIPKGLKKAIEDTQDNLAHIPDEVVRAHMDGIIGRSNGRIQRIEVQKSLGAASVGQAFLCTVYGKDMEKGKQVVIKLLRPDVRNRMMREKQVMLNAARRTDEADMLPVEIEARRKKNQIGGMEATYIGNLKRIEEELDLTKEAENCKKGAVYDKVLIDPVTKKEKMNISNSMKLSDLANPTSDTCVMELAGTKTVKAYMSEIKEKNDSLMRPFCEKTEEVDSEGKKTGRMIPKRDKEGNYILRTDLTQKEKMQLLKVKDELTAMANDLDFRQKALAQVAEKWVSEGIFNAGYYHGDLHAGNIMISGKGVTIIDFGNATILNKEQQAQITRMMMAATFGDVESFRHAFHTLLENTPEEVYQEKREELTLAFTEVLSMGTETDAALRIAVALAKAQEIGLELPPVIANFASCQMRLQNTIKDVNNTLKGIQSSISLLDRNALFNPDICRADAVSSVIQKTVKSRTKRSIKKVCKETLSRMETISEEDFLKILDERPESLRDEFGIGNTVKLNAELKRMEEFVKGARPTKEEKDTVRKNGIGTLFPEMDAYINQTADLEYKNFLMHMFQQLESLIELRNTAEEQEALKDLIPEEKYKTGVGTTYKSLEDYAHNAGIGPNSQFARKWKKYKVLPEVTAFDNSVDGYFKEREKEKNNEALKNDDKHKEELLLLGKQIYAGYRLKQEKNISEAKKQLESRLIVLLPGKFKSLPGDEAGIKDEREGFENNIALLEQIIECSASNRTNGKELTAEYKKLKEIMNKCMLGPEEQKQHLPEMINQFKKV